MYIGGRSEGVVLVVILLLLYHYYDKPIKFKRFMVVAVIGYFFLSLLSVVAMIRTQSMLGLSDYVEAFKSSNNMGQETISEMGWSMYPLASTLNIVPDLYPYRYGASYLYALSSIIPNFGFWELHPAMVNANLGDWLQRKNNLSFGPGYSIVAEAYLNFGYFGGIFLFLFGYVISKLFQMVNVNNIRKNPIIIVCALVFCFFLFKIPRNSFLALVRAFFYYIVPLYVYVVYFHKRIFYKK